MTAAVVLLSAVGLGTFSTIPGAKNTQLSGLNDELGNRNTELAASLSFGEGQGVGLKS